MSRKYYEVNEYEHLGEYFRDKRKDSGITQKELADALNISVRQIIRFEKGTPINSTYLLKMMFVLKITGIFGIFKQVKEFRDIDSSHEEMDPKLKAVLKKNWNF